MRKLLFFMLGVIVVSISQSSAITPDATVSKSKAPGAGVYDTVSAAVDAAPRLNPNKYYIFIEGGDPYEERVYVPNDKINIVLYGDEANKPLITNNLRAGGGIGTDETATLSVDGDGFIAMNLVIENSAGDGQDMQAVAAMTRANHAVYYKCTFLGNQDTLYANSGIHLYKNCDIYGTVDFVFGSAAAVFQTCNFYARVAETITFVAQKKVNPNDFSGFVIQDSNITYAGDLDTSKFNAYLGRPWSNYSTVVVMESNIDGIIQPAGWAPWNEKNNDPRTNLVTILEFNNNGGGAFRDGRVSWSKNITDRGAVEGYTVDRFINGYNWLEATGIDYTGGFVRS